MPEKKTLQRARRAKAQGKAPTTQAGEFVREEMEHAKKGKHPVRSRKQAIAIGLSKARRSGVKVPRKGASPRKSTSSSRKSTAPRKSTARRGASSRKAPSRARKATRATKPRGTRRSGTTRKTRAGRSRRTK